MATEIFQNTPLELGVVTYWRLLKAVSTIHKTLPKQTVYPTHPCQGNHRNDEDISNWLREKSKEGTPKDFFFSFLQFFLVRLHGNVFGLYQRTAFAQSKFDVETIVTIETSANEIGKVLCLAIQKVVQGELFECAREVAIERCYPVIVFIDGFSAKPKRSQLVDSWQSAMNLKNDADSGAFCTASPYTLIRFKVEGFGVFAFLPTGEKYFQPEPNILDLNQVTLEKHQRTLRRVLRQVILRPCRELSIAKRFWRILAKKLMGTEVLSFPFAGEMFQASFKEGSPHPGNLHLHHRNQNGKGDEIDPRAAYRCGLLEEWTCSFTEQRNAA